MTNLQWIAFLDTESLFIVEIYVQEEYSIPIMFLLP